MQFCVYICCLAGLMAALHLMLSPANLCTKSTDETVLYSPPKFVHYQVI